MKKRQISMDNTFLKKAHERPKKYLRHWLDVPAHIHHVAYRMANPPTERPQSRLEFLQLLQCLKIDEKNTFMSDKFGFGICEHDNGDRLLVAWEAHTEYYSYQIWYIPFLKNQSLTYGPLEFPGYYFPFSPLGIRVNALDIIISPESRISEDQIRKMMEESEVYSSYMFGEEICVNTSFTPDQELRERYLIFSASWESLQSQLPRVVDTVVATENYYHLILLPFQAFSNAVDQIHKFEQRHLHQRGAVTSHLNAATSDSLQKWLTVLSEDFLQVSRLAESMRFRLSGTLPYEAIVESNLPVFKKGPFKAFPPLSDYVRWRIAGVAKGYQQLLRRIEFLEKDFENLIAIIRARMDFLLESQNLTLQDQNLKMLQNVDETTKSQALLQQTVEGLSVIVIAYYLSGLANYLFKGLQKIDWIQDASLATAIFVPVAVIGSFALIYFGRKSIKKRLFQK